MLTQMVQLLALLLTFQISTCYAGIGTVEKQTGPAQLTRDNDKITVEKDQSVEMLDTISTADGIIGIGFNDDTKIQIEKHSKLIIDDFIYDAADPTKSKLKMKVGLGTVKYASGKIAKNNKQYAALVLKDNKNLPALKKQVGNTLKLTGTIKIETSKKPDGTPIRQHVYFYLDNY